MLHGLTYSVISHLRAKVRDLNDVVWLYDGVSLTGRPKPFATVEQMQTNAELLAAGRLDYDDTFRFQIGLRARSVSERSRLTDEIKNALRQPHITLLDTSAATAKEAGFFDVEVTAITPMPIESASDETNKHRVYFDVEISVLTNQ